MSEAATTATPRSIAPAVASGVLSGLLSGTAILGIAFLLPVQVTYGRKGWRAGLVAATVSLLVASLVQLGQLALRGGSELEIFGRLTPGLFLAGAVAPPAIFLAALVLMNAPFWTEGRAWARVFSATALVSLAAIPAVIALSRNASFLQWMQDEFKRAFGFLAGLEAPGVVGGAGPGPALSEADLRELTDFYLGVFQSSFVPFFLAFLAGSRWIGLRMSGPGSAGRAEARPVSEFRLPYLLVWPFLAAWTGVFLVSWFKVGMPWSALAWNLAIAISLAYTVQGIGIASHFLRRWNMPKGLRICVAATAVVLFLQPPVGTAIVACLPLLGVTEVWIPYRNPKGVGA
jgi:hypothetical protein